MSVRTQISTLRVLPKTKVRDFVGGKVPGFVGSKKGWNVWYPVALGEGAKESICPGVQP